MSNPQLSDLVRGVTVKIANTARNEGLRGVTTTIRSKGLVTCKGTGGSTAAPCAGPWCVGKAVFVVDPNVEPAPEGERTGWRHGAAQVCLTHVQTADGTPVLEKTEAPAEAEQSPPAVVGIGAGSVPGIVTWPALAHAHARGDLQGLAMMARALKSENDYLMRRLIAVQDHAIVRLQGSTGE